MMKCLAMDFGGSSIKYAVVNEQAELEQTGSAPAPLGSVEEFVDSVEKLYLQYHDEISGIALSLPGVIDAETGEHHGSGVYQDLLAGKNVKELISARCPVKVAVENDGKCGALAEAWKGALAGVKDGAVLVLGSGIGGGVIVNGKVHRGYNFTAGEFSFLLTGRDRSIMDAAWMSVGMLGVTYQTCKRKNLDFSVQDAGDVIASFDQMLGDRYPKFDQPPQKIKADGKQFFQWLEEGDRDVTEIYQEFLHSLAILVENIQICLAPQRIVIGGGLSKAQRLLPDLNRELEQLCTDCNISQAMRPEICNSRYLNECNLLGAVYNYIQQYGENP